MWMVGVEVEVMSRGNDDNSPSILNAKNYSGFPQNLDQMISLSIYLSIYLLFSSYQPIINIPQQIFLSLSM